MTPFFSIIVPVYNVPPYLRECLDSVQVQTFHDWAYRWVHRWLQGEGE